METRWLWKGFSPQTAQDAGADPEVEEGGGQDTDIE